MPNKKQLQEDFIKRFAGLAASFAAGAGIAKIGSLLKNKKKAKQAFADYVKDSERIKKNFEKDLRSMPEKEREDLMKIMKAMG